MADSERRSTLRRLLVYSRSQRPALIWASIFSILNKLFDLAPPLLIGAAVDIVVSREQSFFAGFGVTSTTTQLWLLATVTLAAWGLESVFEYAYALAWRGLAQRLQHELRLDAYSHVQSLDVAYFEDRSTGGLLSILNDDINQLERFLDDGANSIIQLITTVVVVGLLFLIAIPSVGWMAMLPMPVVIYGSVWFQKKLEPKYAEVRERVGALSGRLTNNISGIATIKSFVAEAHELENVERDSHAYESANRSAIRLSSAFVPLIRMTIVLGFCAILVLGGQMALSGKLNVGLYSVLVFMTQRLLWPLTGLGSLLDQYQRAMASTTRVLNLLDTKILVTDGSRPMPAQVEGGIEFREVSFAYGADEASRIPVLHEISFSVPAKNTVAFVGSTGAGKSTLVKLLLRLYDVSGGVICIDGIDIRELKLADLRRMTGLVSQDVFLFSGSVRENIAYGRPDASMDEIVCAANDAEAHEFIEALPNGYDTIVGERGQKLSGGQRQRLSIARALLKDPRILILDEATSAVDNETEAAIQRSLARVSKGRTTVVIAHRLSTVRNADCTYVLDRGRVAESGTHDELVAKGGIYAALWAVQTGGAGTRHESVGARGSV